MPNDLLRLATQHQHRHWSVKHPLRFVPSTSSRSNAWTHCRHSERSQRTALPSELRTCQRSGYSARSGRAGAGRASCLRAIADSAVAGRDRRREPAVAGSDRQEGKGWRRHRRPRGFWPKGRRGPHGRGRLPVLSLRLRERTSTEWARKKRRQQRRWWDRTAHESERTFGSIGWYSGGLTLRVLAWSMVPCARGVRSRLSSSSSASSSPMVLLPSSSSDSGVVD